MYMANSVKNTGLRNYGGTSIYTDEGTDYSTETKVDCRRLDDIYKGGRVSIIKIDVEGHELQVLEGARDTIKRDLPTILIEIHEYDESKVPSLLKELGYIRDPIERPEKMFLFPSPRTYT
jgi:hypothetical protein